MPFVILKLLYYTACVRRTLINYSAIFLMLSCSKGPRSVKDKACLRPIRRILTGLYVWFTFTIFVFLSLSVLHKDSFKNYGLCHFHAHFILFLDLTLKYLHSMLDFFFQTLTKISLECPSPLFFLIWVECFKHSLYLSLLKSSYLYIHSSKFLVLCISVTDLCPIHDFLNATVRLAFLVRNENHVT